MALVADRIGTQSYQQPMGMITNTNVIRAEHPVYGFQEIVIDGQQRLRATAEFMQDKFRVRGELYSEQSVPFKRSFTMHDGKTAIVLCNYKTEKECAELYLRLLRAGTSHTPAEIKKAEAFMRGTSPGWCRRCATPDVVRDPHTCKKDKS